MKARLTAVVLSCTVFLGCGGDNTSSESPSMGTLSLSISDAPIDDAVKVVLGFKDVVLVPIDAETGEVTGEHILLDVRENEQLTQIDLMQFQGSDAASLIGNYSIESGLYAMCLYAVDGPNFNDTSTSYVEKVDGVVKGLVVPNKGSCFGFKPEDTEQGTLAFSDPDNAIEIVVGDNSYVVEFDLRTALADPNGQDHMLMNRNGVTLINASLAGHIHGEVSLTQFQACEIDSASYNAIAGVDPVHAVYLYRDELDGANMGDIGADSERIAPIAVANVSMVDELAEDPVYEYEFGYVQAGTYSVGYTCTAYLDSAESEETVVEGFYIHRQHAPVEVLEGEHTEQNFD